ncbi:uncharacterized protein LOC135471078 [Liolophura sinensis]|uniref:uncharacterized protein LOC135471078 n=1 Tax=Liolophura sinensis TaxID=3198878 RepID=UPI0031583809
MVPAVGMGNILKLLQTGTSRSRMCVQLQPKMPEAAKLTSLSNGGVPMPTLPSITINKMTQAQLRKFIPHLLQNVTGDAIPGFGPVPKPLWWPSDVPWHHSRLDHKTNPFKERFETAIVIKFRLSAFQYKRIDYDHDLTYDRKIKLLGRVDFRYVKSVPESAASPLTMIDNYYRDATNAGLKQESYTRDKWGELPSCNLRSSPRTRRVSNTLLPDIVHPRNTPMPRKDFPSMEAKPFLEIYICFFCEKEFENKRDMCHHQARCKEQPPELKVVLSLPRQPLHIQPPQISPAPEMCIPVARPPKKTFMESLNLLACQKAKEIKAKVRESTDVDCEIIDVIEPPKTPVALTPPRTPKLLISQLSRDESWTRRKSASFSWAPTDLSDDESINSGPSENEPDSFSTCQRNASLLSIPFTSLLGQRIRKHVKSEGQSAVVWNVESFCKTPVKNNALQRLRERQSNYPVTFKKTKRFSTKHTHEYKFNSKQKSDFLKCLEVGLSKRSLRLLKKTRNCSVNLKRLTRSQLNHWLRSGPKGNVSSSKPAVMPVDQMKSAVCLLGRNVFPRQPALLSADMDRILGLKKKVSQEGHQQAKLPLGSIVSEQLNAEASQQKLTVYRSLLSEYSSSHPVLQHSESSKLPCLTNLLMVPTTKTTLPKKPTQLAQMLNTHAQSIASSTAWHFCEPCGELANKQ